MPGTWLEEAVDPLGADEEQFMTLVMAICLVLGWSIAFRMQTACKRLESRWRHYVYWFGFTIWFLWHHLVTFYLIDPLLPTWLQRFQARDSTTPETCEVFDRTLLLNGEGSWPCLLLSLRTWLAYVARLEGWKYLFPTDPILQGTLLFLAINIVYVVGVLKWLRNEARQRAAHPSAEESMQQDIGTGLDGIVKSEKQQRFAESADFA